MSELVPDIALPHDIEVSDLTDDSRAVVDGGLFIAVPGLHVDGRGFVRDAAAHGAAIVLAEAPTPAMEVDIPVVEVEGLAIGTR
ncbi:MAG: Mur ligase domain-containing protein [Gammaproteobacteria bacterium]|nr:Mur ligase domain-containing protein [Gammaproteobacteria bacterium]